MLHVLAEHCRGAALVSVPIRHFIRGMAIEGILRDFLDVGLLTRCLGFIGLIGLTNLQGLGLVRAYIGHLIDYGLHGFGLIWDQKNENLMGFQVDSSFMTKILRVCRQESMQYCKKS